MGGSGENEAEYCQQKKCEAVFGKASFCRPPLCPAGHLPLKGGDWQLHRPRPLPHARDWRRPNRQPISPLEGEMSGRTERGAWRQLRRIYSSHSPPPPQSPQNAVLDLSAAASVPSSR
ncbi:MAG: hypothetical protein E5V80_20180 [Mesorhizobium sp.]|nr:MAG: hypothetical protein E5V80_20180 [Mesorhizobium sp.]